MARLTKEQWAAIRRSWEYDPDKPTYAEAATRAAEKFGFEAPPKQRVAEHASADAKAGQPWQRMGVADMGSVNAAAQRKADGIEPKPDGPDAKPDAKRDASGRKKPDPAPAMSSLEEAENKRADVIARHRQEWIQVGVLRQEALAKRPKKDPVTGAPKPGTGSVGEAFEAMKLAKITAEATAIQQAGERKAWGLDIVIDPKQLQNLSDEDLAQIAAGKAPAGFR